MWYVCVWCRPESLLVLETGSLIDFRLDWLGQLTNELDHTGNYHGPVFLWVLGIQTQGLMLAQKARYQLSSLSLSLCPTLHSESYYVAQPGLNNP